MRIYDAVIRSAPTATAFVDRAKIWEKLKNNQRALADYTAAIHVDPNDSFNFRQRYWLVRDTFADSVQRMKQLDEFVSKEPAFAENYRIRAEARDGSELDKKLADFDQAIRLKPDEPEFRLARADLLEKKGNLAGALADYDRAVQIEPNNAGALYRRGVAKSRKGDRTGAADIAAAKMLDPNIDK